MGDPSKMKAMQYQDVVTGAAKEGTISMGGMYKRQMTENIMNYAMVEDLDKVLAKLEKLGGKIAVPKMEIKGVGWTAIILDTEGNTIGLWKPGMP
jgi:predicted enzyme related to lactoylglutathione lyase